MPTSAPQTVSEVSGATETTGRCMLEDRVSLVLGGFAIACLVLSWLRHGIWYGWSPGGSGREQQDALVSLGRMQCHLLPSALWHRVSHQLSSSDILQPRTELQAEPRERWRSWLWPCGQEALGTGSLLCRGWSAAFPPWWPYILVCTLLMEAF